MEQALTKVQQSGKMAELVHAILIQTKEHPGQRIRVETTSRLTMEHLARVIFFTAGFPKYDLPVEDVSLADQGYILFENGTQIYFSLVASEERGDE